MPSLILEGGTFRPIFSAGIMDALLDYNLEFDYIIGVSAGICNGFSYASKQRGRNLEVLLNYRNDKRYMSKRNYLKDRSIFGIDFIYNQIPNKYVPYDYNQLEQFEGKILVGLTNAQSGKIEYKNGKEIDKKNTMLQATCAIPFFFPPIKLDKQKYYDGGLAEPIPIKKAIQDGNDKHLILLTRTKDYRKKLEKQNIVAAKILRNKYPKLERVLLERHIHYNEMVAFCERLQQENKALILRPEYELNSFESDIEQLKRNYDAGYHLAKENIEEIKKLFE